MTKLGETAANVPCDGCRLCCEAGDLVLDPNDDLTKYKHNLKEGKPVVARKDNGECVYLADNGCSIYDDRPLACQAFDCRKFYVNLMAMSRGVKAEATIYSYYDPVVKRVAERGKELIGKGPLPEIDARQVEVEDPFDGEKQARVLPNLFIPGAMRSGTTMMFDALQHHPLITTGSMKEFFYFDFGIDSGLGNMSYAKEFPSIEILQKGVKYVMEGTPSYIYHEKAMQRIYEFDPNVHVIVMLRDPVDRAISHFQWLKRFHETLFPDENLSRFRGIDRSSGYTYDHDIVARSMYDVQIERFVGLFGNLYFVEHERFMEDMDSTMNEVCEFLGVEWKSAYWAPPPYKDEKAKLVAHHVNEDDRNWLKEVLTPSAKRLFTEVIPDFNPTWRGKYV